MISVHFYVSNDSAYFNQMWKLYSGIWTKSFQVLQPISKKCILSEGGNGVIYTGKTGRTNSLPPQILDEKSVKSCASSKLLDTK